MTVQGDLKTSHYAVLDVVKGFCAVFVIMLHSIPGGGTLNRLLLMPFYAQLTIPFFMMVSGFTWDASAEKRLHWYTKGNLFGKCKRMLLPYLPALLLELVLLGLPDNPLVWLASGGYQMPGSYYVILMLQLIVLFPAVRKFYEWNTAKGGSWAAGLAWVFAFQCLYEAATYMTDLSIGVYRLLIFRYVIFLYAGICLRRMYITRTFAWRQLRRMIPFGALFILAVGYLNWQPTVLFRYSTWYRSSAPTVLWAMPLLAYALFRYERLSEKLESAAIGRWLTKTLQLCGKASYHIYIVQMLWFGLAISHLNTASYRQLIVFLVSVPVCCVVGWLYYTLECNLSETMQKYNSEA